MSQKSNDGLEKDFARTCSGYGGTFTVYHHEMSKIIGNQKADNIINSVAKTVATSCSACMMQMTDILSRLDKGIGVKHVVVIYADSL